MKLALVFIFSVIPLIASAEEVNKWVDDKGKVHYGNVPSDTEGMPASKVEIKDTFDQKEYEKAKKRHVETEQFGKELEKERKADEEKKAKEEAERKASIKQPPPSAGPRINLPAPYYEAPRVPGKPWVGIPVQPRPTPLPSAE